MPYEPPSGWVEELLTEEDAPARSRFHTSQECSLIGDAQRLTAVDKPYAATRCSRCAAV